MTEQEAMDELARGGLTEDRRLFLLGFLAEQWPTVSTDDYWTSEVELIALSKWAAGKLRVAEVGTWKGRAALALRRFMPTAGILYCVDDWCGDPSISRANVWFKDRHTAKSEWVERTKDIRGIQLVEAESKVAAAQFDDGYFDLVFIDACHQFDYVVADIKAWKPKIRANGILCGHDYNQKDVRLAVMQELMGQHILLGPEKLWRVLL